MKPSKRFRVRFHLGKGKHFKHWQVLDKKNGHYRDYYDPDKVDIIMYKSRLGNHPATARKIYEGAHKTVCAWVECDMVEIKYHSSPMYEAVDTSQLTMYKYNPKKNPYWFTDEESDVDGREFKVLSTKGRNIYG